MARRPSAPSALNEQAAVLQAGWQAGGQQQQQGGAAPQPRGPNQNATAQNERMPHSHEQAGWVGFAWHIENSLRNTVHSVDHLESIAACFRRLFMKSL
jgi:hypothetical protein